MYVGRVVLLKWSFVAHTSVNVLLEMEGKYAGIYSCILAIYCFEYSTARMECSVHRNVSHSVQYSIEKRREVDPPCKWARKVASYGSRVYVNELT
jgi:hypothetical protein